MKCNRPLDDMDLAALAAGEPEVLPAETAQHAASCPDCARRLREFQEISLLLDQLPGPADRPDMAASVERLRSFSAREKRSVRIWAVPAIAFAGLLVLSAVLVALPLLTSTEQASLLGALVISFAAQWHALWAWPASLWQAFPAGVAGLSAAVLRGRTLAAAGILLLLPFGWATSRVLAWRKMGR